MVVNYGLADDIIQQDVFFYSDKYWNIGVGSQTTIIIDHLLLVFKC